MKRGTGIDFTSFYDFQLNFGIVSIAWYFLFFILNISFFMVNHTVNLVSRCHTLSFRTMKKWPDQTVQVICFFLL